jgi:hypothetical protein
MLPPAYDQRYPHGRAGEYSGKPLPNLVESYRLYQALSTLSMPPRAFCSPHPRLRTRVTHTSFCCDPDDQNARKKVRSGLTTTRQNPCHYLRLFDNFRRRVLTQRWTRVCAWQCVRQSSWGTDHFRTAWHTRHYAADSRTRWRTPIPLSLPSRSRSARAHRPETSPPLEGARRRPRPGRTT